MVKDKEDKIKKENAEKTRHKDENEQSLDELVDNADKNKNKRK